MVEKPKEMKTAKEWIQKFEMFGGKFEKEDSVEVWIRDIQADALRQAAEYIRTLWIMKLVGKKNEGSTITLDEWQSTVAEGIVELADAVERGETMDSYPKST